LIPFGKHHCGIILLLEKDIVEQIAVFDIQNL
jgi:hypothetical protein